VAGFIANQLSYPLKMAEKLLLNGGSFFIVAYLSLKFIPTNKTEI
jgi:hypothetical protein